jgi:hypothetical protein
MTERTKKILLLILFIIITLLIGFALYYFFFRPFIAPPAPTPTIPPLNLPPTGFPVIPPALNLPVTIPALNLPPGVRPEIPTIPPTAAVPGPEISYQATGGITAFQTLSDTTAQNAVLSTDGKNLIYYDSPTGFFYSLTPTGEKKVFSTLPFKNVSNAVWSPNKEKVILEYPDGSNIIYNFTQKKSITLPSHWKDFSFSKDSNQIAFKDMRLDPESRYIAIADTNGGSYQEIQALGKADSDVYVSWSPNNQYIALFREPLDADRSEVYPIGFKGENFQKLIVEGRDLKFQWSPSGSRLLYSVFNSRSNYNPLLWVANSDPNFLGTGRKSLELQTWANKCAFYSDSIIYCAVPQSLDQGMGFSEDMANEIPDNFYKINVDTGTKEFIAQPLFSTTVDKLMVSEDGQYLYWTEKISGQIKKINL